MRKQFDLQYYLEHPETNVVTRDGRDVRIMFTDLKSEVYPIAAEYINKCGPRRIGPRYEVSTFTVEGKIDANTPAEHDTDLFFDFPDPPKETDAASEI